MRRPRLRKWAKWACTLAAAMALGVAVFSGLYRLEAVIAPPEEFPLWRIRVEEGEVLLQREKTTAFNVESDEMMPDWQVKRHVGWRWGLRGPDNVRSRGDWHAGVLWSRD